MQVAQYTFQSPSTSAVQVGKLDPSSVEQEAKKNSAPVKPAISKNVGEILKADTITSTNKPTVTTKNLDVYV